MNQSLPSAARVAFLCHLIVAVLLGLGFLIIPATVGSWFDYSIATDIEPIIRCFGAMILGFGGLTSYYGYRAQSWERVAYIVHGEITYLAIQTVVLLVSAIAGVGPALGNWVFTILSAILFILFGLAFLARPK